ncbi:LD-carboxypeptidase, partial [Mesorhizobium sp. M00.F.Ca.ET.186.01.1.1]
ANHAVQGYTAEDVYQELADELRIPVLYDIDCGHMPPQMTFVNGARATVDMAEGRAKVTQHFCP